MATKFQMLLYSRDYYSNEDCWTFTLPKTITTLDEAQKWVKEHLKEILEPGVGGTWISKTHFRFERGRCEGNATYEVDINELTEEDESWDQFVKDWNKYHPHNRPEDWTGLWLGSGKE